MSLEETSTLIPSQHFPNISVFEADFMHLLLNQLMFLLSPAFKLQHDLSAWSVWSELQPNLRLPRQEL